jgi:hypothetical protein
MLSNWELADVRVSSEVMNPFFHQIFSGTVNIILSLFHGIVLGPMDNLRYAALACSSMSQITSLLHVDIFAILEPFERDPVACNWGSWILTNSSETIQDHKISRSELAPFCVFPEMTPVLASEEHFCMNIRERKGHPSHIEGKFHLLIWIEIKAIEIKML